MSWLDKINNGALLIRTGDGKSFKPLWRESTREREFNTSIFDFIDFKDSFVSKRKPRSHKYGFIVYFQGDDCFDLADEFEKSAEDERYWIVSHPIYGELRGQPLSLARNDSMLNVVEISIDFWESIISNQVVEVSTIKDEINQLKSELDSDSATNFNIRAKLTPANQTKIREFIGTINSEYKKFLDDSSYNDFQQTLSKFNDSVDGAIVDSRSMMVDMSRTIDSIKNLPNSTVFQKVTSISNLFNQLISEFSISNMTDFNRYYIESAGSSIISTLSLVSLNAEKDEYISRTEVQRVSTQIESIFVKYVEMINGFESERNHKNNRYNISFKIQNQLNTIVKRTLEGLISIAFQSKQERLVELKSDSNLILLTHRYMGLDDSDLNLETFRRLNNIVNEKLFIIKRGNVIKYLV